MTRQTTHTCRSALILLKVAALGLMLSLAASAATARTEVVRWTHPDPTSVLGFRVYISTSSMVSSVTAQLFNPGLPIPTSAGVYTFALSVPETSTVWVSVSAVNAAGEGPLSTAQRRAAPAPAPAPPTPAPTPPPTGRLPSVGSILTSSAATPNWTVLGIGDFDGDGRKDIVWSDGSRRMISTMNGATVMAEAETAGVSSNWRLAGIGDLDGNGTDDLVLRNRKTNAHEVWFMAGTQVVRMEVISGMSRRWVVRGVADFNADGRDDLLISKHKESKKRHDYRILFMNGSVGTAGASMGLLKSHWKPAGLPDLDGDGHADIVWRNSKSNEYQAWLLRSGGPVGGGSLGVVGWGIVGVADFDGDGSTDIAWHDSSSGDRIVWYMDGPMVRDSDVIAGSNGAFDLSDVGDFDGDGIADLLWSNNGDVEVWLITP